MTSSLIYLLKYTCAKSLKTALPQLYTTSSNPPPICIHAFVLHRGSFRLPESNLDSLVSSLIALPNLYPTLSFPPLYYSFVKNSRNPMTDIHLDFIFLSFLSHNHVPYLQLEGRGSGAQKSRGVSCMIAIIFTRWPIMIICCHSFELLK